MIAVLTCDIVASRAYSEVQRQILDSELKAAFKESCEKLPQAGADYLSFSIIQGDEFQFNLAAPQYFYHFLLYFRNRFAISGLTPTPSFRAGIGFGQRSVAGSSNSYQMDGSAYHHAREAMNGFSGQANKHRLSLVNSDAPDVQNCINTILAFCDNIELNWTSAQRNTIANSFLGDSTKQIATLMGVSRQNVEKLLKSAKWELICSAMSYLSETKWLWQG